MSHLITIKADYIYESELSFSYKVLQGYNEALLFGTMFAEKCIKMKEFGPKGGVHIPSAHLDPLLGGREKIRLTNEVGYA